MTSHIKISANGTHRSSQPLVMLTASACLTACMPSSATISSLDMHDVTQNTSIIADSAEGRSQQQPWAGSQPTAAAPTCAALSHWQRTCQAFCLAWYLHPLVQGPIWTNSELHCRVSATAKLGWQSANSCYTPLHCVQPKGGTIPYTLLLVRRKFPKMIWEKLPSGVTRTHTPKAYQAAESTFETEAAKARRLINFLTGISDCQLTCRAVSPGIGLLEEGLSQSQHTA